MSSFLAHFQNPYNEKNKESPLCHNPKKKNLLSPREYFEGEEIAEYKSEYYHGEIFAMSGASFNHNVISMNVTSDLHGKLRDSSCFVLAGDMKIQIEEDDYYTYPDISIVCGDIEFGQNRDDIIENPLVIIEILSRSTRSYDRGDKFTAYRQIGSLRDYILIDQHTRHVEHFFKNKAGRWELEELRNPDDILKIRSVDAELSLKTVYDRVRF